MSVHCDGLTEPGPEWQRLVLPGSALEHTGTTWRFLTERTLGAQYTDSQIDDYQGLRRRDFKWRPPLRMTIRARFSHPSGKLMGTAGFGFWNDPFMMTGARPPIMPRAIWFFYASPPSNMKLDIGTPGQGWKAATIDALRLPTFLLAPLAPLAIPLMNIKPLYRACWPVAQRAINVSEAALTAELTAWHTYTLDWGARQARFFVDEEPVLACDTPPRGPLGFVMWLDNQAMTVTPWGRFGYRLLEVPHQQWMEVDTLILKATG